MTVEAALSPTHSPPRATMADAVYQDLRRAILELRLKPGMRVSEAEIARRMGVSRQPVREAFIRLARIGYLRVQPQRATEIVKISVQEVLNARFIREALEIAVVRRACEGENGALIEQLTDNLARQHEAQEADDRREFHRLDDMFHRLIADGAGCGFAWELIDEQKAQLDRMRFLTLSYGQPAVYDDHYAIFEALKARDAAAAEAAMRIHLGRIIRHLERLKTEFEEYFEDTGAGTAEERAGL
ncbi:GntR family transcriptional regulator [Aurantimonas sp. VKM B-3413]|uniref:GntR family transcriptional regulator n=1 Tax=Aurantimonas sp. VKM B-3413 TaxID=2779401 RepID=UPI001E313F28|nr:GntR family transcriptional regulator [Aurantimonas sp. VKM B-3413]MCB8839314.1 GntR family transcriptional regulator [Aurantimonas sp. VKM B-3413]